MPNSTERRRGGPVVLTLLSLVSTVVMGAFALLLAYVLRRENLLHAFSLSAQGAALAAAGAALAFFLAGGLYILWPGLRAVTNRVAVTLVDTALERGGWVLLALTTLVPPLGEEMLFRGALQPSLGLWLASVLFGLAHGGWRRDTWPYAVSAGISGVVVGGVFLQTGSLAASALTHILYNAAVTVLMARRWWPFLGA